VAHSVVTQARVIGTKKDVATTCVPTVGNGICNEMDSPGPIPPRGTHRYDFGNTEGVWQYTGMTDATPTDATMQGTIVIGPTDR
jgi:hypothetical protein